MKVLLLNGSPRKGGNTSIALEEMERVFAEEGVETEDQYDMLLDMGCRMFQGYYFAKPMPVDGFVQLYRAA